MRYGAIDGGREDATAGADAPEPSGEPTARASARRGAKLGRAAVLVGRAGQNLRLRVQERWTGLEGQFLEGLGTGLAKPPASLTANWPTRT